MVRAYPPPMHTLGAHVAKPTRWAAVFCLAVMAGACGYIGPHDNTPSDVGVASVTADAGDRTATLQWPPPSPQAEGGIRILVSPAPENGPAVFTLPQGTRTWTHDGLTNGVTYTFTIEFLGSDGQAFATRMAVATPDVVPALNVAQAILRTIDSDAAQALNVTVTPSDADVTFISSNPAVATVDADGRVQPLAAGRTVVTASIEGASDSVEVLVGSTTPEDCSARTVGDWEGSGTEADPYLVYTDMDAACIRDVFYDNANPIDASFALAHNVHFGSVGGQWTLDDTRMLPKFSGVFDGRGFTVSGLVLERTPIDDLEPGGVVRNVTLLEPQATTGDVRGLVADEVDDATVENVTITNGRLVTSKVGVSIGGLVGHVSKGAVLTGNDVHIAIEATSASGNGVGLLTGKLLHNNVETGKPGIVLAGNRLSGSVDAPGAHVGGVFGYAQMGGTADSDYDWSEGRGVEQVYVAENTVEQLVVDRAAYAAGVGVMDSAHCAVMDASNTVLGFETAPGGVTQASAGFLQGDTTGAQYSKAAGGYNCW